jgi:glucokinase
MDRGNRNPQDQNSPQTVTVLLIPFTFFSKLSYIAVDIGASNVRIANGDERGIKAKLLEPIDKQNGPQGVSTQIIRLIEELVEYPEAIGIGSIGPLDLERGMITNTPNYPFNDIEIKKPIFEAFEAPTVIANDCSAAVLGEKAFGAGKTTDNLFYLTLSTGLGGGAIVDGHLLTGKDGNAVEIGHLTMFPDSRIMCGCGSPGHWEAFCGGKNIPYFARTMLRRLHWRSSLLYDLCQGNPKKITTKMIFDAAKQGDDSSISIVEEVGKINSIGLADIVNAYDPELITIGGAIALNNPDMIMIPIEHYTSRYVINRMPRIMITPLGEDVVLYGGLALAMRETGVPVSNRS